MMMMMTDRDNVVDDDNNDYDNDNDDNDDDDNDDNDNDDYRFHASPSKWKQMILITKLIMITMVVLLQLFTVDFFL